MSEENVEVVREALAALGGSLTDAALGEFFDPEVEWVPVPQGVLAGRKYLGFEGIRRFSGDFTSAWDEISVEPRDFQASGDLVAGVLRMRGRMRELKVDELWSGLFTLRDGRIVRVQGFASRSGALEAAGLEE